MTESHLSRGLPAFLYGLFSYAVFLAVFVYAIGFIGGFMTPSRRFSG